MASPSSPPPADDAAAPTTPSGPPTVVGITLSLPAPPLPQSETQPPASSATAASRRLPPPCWSHDETVALIDSYRDKWYSLRRGNLKATHWQEVADSVARRCSAASPPKTAVQCRHKMEKLRKRYRTELQRARSMPVSRFTSSWVHFKRMDAMEKGPSSGSSKKRVNVSDSDNDNDIDAEDDEDQDLYEEFKNGGGPNMRHMSKLYRNNGIGGGSGGGGGGSGGSGFRIRIPSGVSIAQPGSKYFGKAEHKYNSNPNSTPNPNPSSSSGGNFGARVLRECNSAGSGKRERDPVTEMVSAIKVLGDGFVKMEQMKMEMAREIEAMRMEMEMKRTEMILESQQRIVEAFAKAVSEKKKKKAKRMTSPES
ncbi:hypothetical protein I3760_13G022700 [Carya illinoinensis]|uniref:Myb/SANT-like DNA-binding domain-containing protein n=1 Tax=Carya illinoinensis TaxID=32201 RepID=A0A8T1NL73_CARIL|nr:trihelix transcription factor ASIL2-like [Carya illinoinensis]KAG2672082.1 hypothetical protein I3760_13G022700 [Carya illinoinensis]KAG6630521.1 hypothetical protein CIPAW_13G024400 [Carya illinoinensis]KAG6680101.1 hypothetical protein I3842_13G023900 [Carya illinoinensis]